MPSIIYIDPQSYNNLSLYDLGMMTAMQPNEVVIFGSQLWDCKLPNAQLKTWFKYNTKKNTLLKGISYIYTIAKITKYINSHPEIKIVHVQWLRLWKIDYLFAKWLRRKQIKVIFTAHNVLPHDTGDSHLDKYNIYYKTVDYICVHAETTKLELINQFNILPDKIIVIPHGIIYSDVPEQTILSKAEIFRKNFNISQDTLVISSLGIQSYYKGIDILINVWAKEMVLNTNTHIKLLIVGKNSGVDYTPLNGLENVIIIDNKVSNEDFQTYLEISNILLLPYRVISQSGVLFSAIARNKPVIVSNAGGLGEPLKIGNIGWNIGYANENSLRSTLIDIITCPFKVKSIQNNIKEFYKVKEYYSWESISKRLKKLYEDIINCE